MTVTLYCASLLAMLIMLHERPINPTPYFAFLNRQHNHKQTLDFYDTSGQLALQFDIPFSAPPLPTRVSMSIFENPPDDRFIVARWTQYSERGAFAEGNAYRLSMLEGSLHRFPNDAYSVYGWSGAGHLVYSSSQSSMTLMDVASLTEAPMGLRNTDFFTGDIARGINARNQIYGLSLASNNTYCLTQLNLTDGSLQPVGNLCQSSQFRLLSLAPDIVYVVDSALANHGTIYLILENGSLRILRSDVYGPGYIGLMRTSYGKELLYIDTGDGWHGTSLRILNIASEQEMRVPIPSSTLYKQVTWSANGRFIAITTSSTPAMRSRGNHTYVYDREQNRLHTLHDPQFAITFRGIQIDHTSDFIDPVQHSASHLWIERCSNQAYSSCEVFSANPIDMEDAIAFPNAYVPIRQHDQFVIGHVDYASNSFLLTDLERGTHTPVGINADVFGYAGVYRLQATDTLSAWLYVLCASLLLLCISMMWWRK